MKGPLILVVIGVLLAAFLPYASARERYESIKSNNGDFQLSYDPNFVTRAQAAAVLDDLERSDEPADEPGVRDILRKQGVQNDSVKKIIIEKGPNGGKGATILLLIKPSDESSARSSLI